MTFFEFLDRTLDRMPGWPRERTMITWMTWSLAVGMLIMAKDNPELWAEDLYKGLLMLVVGTGFINMILAFHFTANKSDETKTENTAKAFDAIKAAQEANPNIGSNGNEVEAAAEEVALAAVEAKDDIVNAKKGK